MTTTPQPPHEPHPNHDRGLEFDLSTLLSRRSLGMFLGAGSGRRPGRLHPGRLHRGRRVRHAAATAASPDAGSLRQRGGHGTPSARSARPR